MSMTVDQCYRVLGVAPGATEEQLRIAYRRMAIMHHPDRNNGSKESEAKFREISEAYETLRNRGSVNAGDDLFEAFGDLLKDFLTLLNSR